MLTATASLADAVAACHDHPYNKCRTLYLERRATNVGAGATVYWICDSTTTDANGIYDFLNMIAGTAANYRVNITMLPAMWIPIP